MTIPIIVSQTRRRQTNIYTYRYWKTEKGKQEEKKQKIRNNAALAKFYPQGVATKRGVGI